MGMNVTAVFLDKGLKALARADVTEEQQEELCDIICDLCEIYAPGTFSRPDDYNGGVWRHMDTGEMVRWGQDEHSPGGFYGWDGTTYTTTSPVDAIINNFNRWEKISDN